MRNPISTRTKVILLLICCVGVVGCNPSSPPEAGKLVNELSNSQVNTEKAPEEPLVPQDASQLSSRPASVSEETTSAEDTAAEDTAAEVLESELAAFRVPPAWIDRVESPWDRSKPWKDARLEIRRLLGINTESSRQEALRLMWDYRQKADMGDGHEYSMYTYLGQEPLWAIVACREWLAKEDHPFAPNFSLKALASLYLERGLYSQAESVLKQGLNWPPVEETWRRAEFLDALGDLYVASGRIDDARTHYQASIELYPKTNPPYGQHLIPRRVKTIENKMDVLSLGSLEDIRLQDGDWSATVPGYAEDIVVTVQVEQGRLSNIQLQHDEKIDQGATIEIPRRIVDQQTLNVDGITGATITKDAIVTGALQSLRKAGLK